MKRSQIITNQDVDTTFEGEPTLLLRTIVSVLKRDDKKTYTIRTNRCKFVTIDKVIVADDGTESTQTVTGLKILSQKDADRVREFTFSQIDQLYNSIKNQIPLGLTKTESEAIEESIVLLLLTQQENAWGIPADKWIIFDGQ